MTQILYHAVTGATGTQGGATARALLKAGQRVKALTRNVNSPAAAALRDLGAEVTYADFGDRSTLDAALSEVDTLFAVTTPFESSTQTETEQGRRLVDAAKHLSHIVFTSATNADRDTGIPHFASKFAIETHLRTQQVPWTIIAPAAFMDAYRSDWHRTSYARGELSVPMPADKPLALIAAADIGAFAAHALTHRDEFAGRRIDLASDELTGTEIAEILGAALDRPIRYVAAPLSAAERYSPDLAAMFRYFGTTGMTVDVAALRAAYPDIGWHRLADWAPANLP